MATTMKRPWLEGDTGWEVEWCSVLPVDENGDADRDSATHVARYYRDKAAAEVYARKVYPKDQFGSVAITPFVLERLCEDHRFDIEHNCRLEHTADSEFYEGDD